MSPATKAEAIKKLDTYNIKVGYPDHPRDYSNVFIKSDDLWATCAAPRPPTGHFMLVG